MPAEDQGGAGTTPGWHRITPGRAFVGDILHFWNMKAMQPVFRHMDLVELVRLRRECPVRVSWTILFLRAYALLSTRQPVLRQAYMRYPWPHVYQHDQSAAVLSIARQHRGEERVFFGLFRTPEERTLAELSTRLGVFQHHPIEQMREFRAQLLLGRLPRPLRRLVWWLTLHVSGLIRVRHLGTFYITSLGHLGVTAVNPPALQSTALTFGPIGDDGKVEVAFIYDHRLMDGTKVAQMLGELEGILRGEVAEELRKMKGA